MCAREEDRTSARLALWRQARADAERIIEWVVACFNPRRIIQWGSVLESRHFSEISDIDLAIEGVGSLAFLDLMRGAEEKTDFSLDLVRWENLEPEFQRILLMKGRIRYCRSTDQS